MIGAECERKTHSPEGGDTGTVCYVQIVTLGRLVGKTIAIDDIPVIV